MAGLAAGFAAAFFAAGSALAAGAGAALTLVFAAGAGAGLAFATEAATAAAAAAGLASTAAAGSRAVFIQASDAGWDVMESELQLANPTDSAGEVTLRAFDTEGVAAGEPVTLTLGPKESVRVPAAFFTLSGFGAPIGRIDVAPVAGSQPVFALLVRRDQKPGDADAVVPYVVPAA